MKIGGREWLVALAPVGEVLAMEMTRSAAELRAPADFFDEVPMTKPEKEMVDLAVQRIEDKSAPYQPSAYQYLYQSAVTVPVK